MHPYVLCLWTLLRGRHELCWSPGGSAELFPLHACFAAASPTRSDAAVTTQPSTHPLSLAAAAAYCGYSSATQAVRWEGLWVGSQAWSCAQGLQLPTRKGSVARGRVRLSKCVRTSR